MNLLLLNIILALVWAALTGQFRPGNLILGFGFGFLILWLTRGAFGPSAYFSKVPKVIGFLLFFLWELILANLRVARRILSPLDQMRPRVIAVPLDTCNDIEMTILANLISLTPGTLSLDVSGDECVLYVHSLYAPDPEMARQELKESFERRVLALTRNTLVPLKGEKSE